MTDIDDKFPPAEDVFVAETPVPEFEVVEGHDDGPERFAEEELAETVAPRRPRGLYLTPRQTFTLMAGVLSAVLVALLLYLWLITRPADYTKEGGATVSGIVPELAIYGPGTHDLPKFDGPMGAAWDEVGKRIYVADTTNNRIVVFDQEGRYLNQWGGLGVAKPLQGSQRTWNPGELSYPTDVAVSDAGDVYVADFYNDSISVFDRTGKFLRRFPDPYKPTGRGSSGSSGGGIAVSALAVKNDLVYATDAYQVFVFTTKGEFVRQFGKPGSGPTDLDRPGGIAVAEDGTVYVSDSNHNRIVAFDEKGEPIWVVGRPVAGMQQSTDNPFVLPRGIAILRDGRLVVADPLGQQLVILDTDGRVIASLGGRGVEEGKLNFPNDVASYKDKLLIADRENDRAQVVHLESR